MYNKLLYQKIAIFQVITLFILTIVFGIIFSGVLKQVIIQSVLILVILNIITYLIFKNDLLIHAKKALKDIDDSVILSSGMQTDKFVTPEIGKLCGAYRNITDSLTDRVQHLNKIVENLTFNLNKSKELTTDLNTSATEIEAAAQEQSTAISEHASGITEVSATLEELSITARQITKNVGELVTSSEEVLALLDDSEKQLLHTVSDLDEVGKISATNSTEIAQLGKKSEVINQMVKIIREIANKTNMLSINASIEASKSKESGAGFAVIASEIRELSQATINSAKNVGKAAKEIDGFFSFIIKSTEIESKKVNKSASVARAIYDNMEAIVGKVKNNYSFTQKIDVSIKQQETGSRQAADTMKQMAEISRQSAETARQTSVAINNIVKAGTDLDNIIKSCDTNTVIESDNGNNMNVIADEIESSFLKKEIPPIKDRLAQIFKYQKDNKILPSGINKFFNTIASEFISVIVKNIPGYLLLFRDRILKTNKSFYSGLLIIKQTVMKKFKNK